MSFFGVGNPFATPVGQKIGKTNINLNFPYAVAHYLK